MGAVATTINDWIEGARRLTADDVAAWERPPPASVGAPGLKAAAVELDVGPPVGSMERVLDVQAECMADDLAVDEKMIKWTEARLRHYFENGGES